MAVPELITIGRPTLGPAVQNLRTVPITTPGTKICALFFNSFKAVSLNLLKLFYTNQNFRKLYL